MLLTYREAVDAFRQTDRLTEAERGQLMDERRGARLQLDAGRA